MNIRRLSNRNIVIIGYLLILVYQIYQPVIKTGPINDIPGTISFHNDFILTIESPTSVLSGTTADIKLIMNNPKQMNIILKSIEFTYSDFDMDTLYKSSIMYELELHDSHEAGLKVPIPEIYQLYHVSETDIPISCTVSIMYEEDGFLKCNFTSFNIQIFDRFLETENTERVFNSEPIAIT